MKNFWKSLIILVFLVTTVTCTTTVGFNVYDKETKNPVPDYTIEIEGEKNVLQAGDTIVLSTAVWKDYRARIQANGYIAENLPLAKEVYVGRAIVGYFIFWPELLWCYGPKEQQTFYLVRNNK